MTTHGDLLEMDDERRASVFVEEEALQRREHYCTGRVAFATTKLLVLLPASASFLS